MAFKIRHIYDTIFAMKFTGIVHGVVQKGDGLGTKIGFPTINLDAGACADLTYGVYIVRVGGAQVGEAVGGVIGVMHFGPRPSVSAGAVGGPDPSEIRLEIHLLDFSRDLYGKTVIVTVLDKIRDVMRFSSLEELKARIAKDILLARVRVYGP